MSEVPAVRRHREFLDAGVRGYLGLPPPASNPGYEYSPPEVSPSGRVVSLDAGAVVYLSRLQDMGKPKK